MKQWISAAFAAIILLLFAPPAFAIEGDIEVGGMPGAFFSPNENIYGGGADLFVRYDVVDGLYLTANAGLYGARDTYRERAVGIYNIRLGALYTLDILEWVPALGITFSKVFSEDHDLPWMSSASHGFSVDFEAQLQYRGINSLGLALVFTYHVCFKDSHYMTTGIAVSWHSDSF